MSTTNSDTTWSQQVLQAELNLCSARTNGVERSTMATSTDIYLQKVLTSDDYDDEDCMEESIKDLREVAQQHGELEWIRASDEKDGNVILHYKCDVGTARTIANNLCRTVVGGKPLYAFVKEGIQHLTNEVATTILLDNILSEDDLEDEECLTETLSDIREICGRYGVVSTIAAKGRSVRVTYQGDTSVGDKAASELDGLVLGGNVVAASVVSDDQNHVILSNVLTEDDLDDDDCLHESLRDIRELASKYGVIASMEVLRADDVASIRIKFEGDSSVADAAANNLHGIVIGGQICSAISSNQVEAGRTKNESAGQSSAGEMSGDKRKSSDESGSDKKARTDEKTPLYSGDKLIPERFAEMKRVPKVPNAPGPREYAGIVNDERVKPLLIEMLGELMRLQKRAIEDKNAKARRRIVMGLREVARGIRANKVKLVVMANNLDEYGVIDEKLQEIIDLAKSHDVPVFFEFTKRSLGKALGKSIKIAVVGVQSADGAHQPFKKLNAIAATSATHGPTGTS